MKTHIGCTYWYQISMHVDKKGDGICRPANVRVPVGCVGPGENSSVVQYLNPSSAAVEFLNVENCHLYESPIPTTPKNEKGDRFTQGYTCAAANLVRMYGNSTMVDELMACNTNTIEGLQAAGCEPEDIEILLPTIKELERKRNL
jgi:hypothetical protein